jgi:hypothetical protein
VLVAGALYVSNPRGRSRGRLRSRGNPRGSGSVRTAILAEDVARILAGDKPMSPIERRAEGLLKRSRALQDAATRSKRIEQAVSQLEPEALNLAAREVALRRALASVRSETGGTKRKRRSKRRKGRRAARRRNPFMGLNFGALEVANPRRRRRGSKRKSRRGGHRGYANRNRKGQFVRGRHRHGRRARNPLTISNPMSGVPVVGTAIAMIGPALFGAIGVEAIGQSTKLLKSYVAIPEMLAPYEYTVGGLILAGVVQLITPIPAPVRHSLGVGLASAGGAVDWYRFRSASGSYGDGGSWSVEMGDAEAFGALDMSGIDFSGDEDYCGPDFSMDEGMAAADGYGAYQARFPIRRPRHPGVAAHRAHDPRREGDRWHWLARLVGPEDFRRIANMSPSDRLQMIQRCKDACKSALHPAASQALIGVNNVEAAGSPLPDPRSLTSVPFANEQWAI